MKKKHDSKKGCTTKLKECEMLPLMDNKTTCYMNECKLILGSNYIHDAHIVKKLVCAKINNAKELKGTYFIILKRNLLEYII